MKAVLLITAIFFSVFAQANNRCLIWDERGLDTEGIEDVLVEKGFTITNEFPENAVYFSISKDRIFHRYNALSFTADIVCFESDINSNAIESKVTLYHSEANSGRSGSVDILKGGLFYNCPDTADTEYEQNKKESLITVAEDLATCEEYLSEYSL